MVNRRSGAPSPARVGGTDDLLERDREFAIASDALARARSGHGSIVTIVGTAGIGKTALSRWMRRQAGDAWTTLFARCGEMESDSPHGVVRQLFDPLVRGGTDARRDELFAGAAGLAESVVFPHTRDEERLAADPAPSILHGLYWLTATLAEECPVVLIVDDAQWADAASLAFIEYLGRRLEDLPVLIVLTIRDPDDSQTGDRESLARIMADSTTRILRLDALSTDAVRSMVRTWLPAAEDTFCDTCAQVTGGNPFLLHELLGEIRTEGIAPTATNSQAIDSLAPQSVSRSVLVRLARVTPAAVRLAQSLAVLDGRADLRDVARLGDMDFDDAESAADELTRAAIVRDIRPLEFAHPLLRTVVYEEIPRGQRGIDHKRAARILAEAGAPSSIVASQLLATDGSSDDWIVDALRRAAADALATGAAKAAVKFLERATREPPATSARLDTLMELGLAQAKAGDPNCTDTLTDALRLGIDAAHRAQVQLELARTLWYLRSDIPGALAVLADIERSALDDESALRIESQLIEFQIGWGDGLGGLGATMRETSLVRLHALESRAYPARPETSLLLGTLARTVLEEGAEARIAARLAEDSIIAGEESFLYASAPDVLVWSEAFDVARTVLDRFIAEGQRRGSAYMFAVASLWRGVLGYRVGELREAETDCRACLDIMLSLGVVGVFTYPSAFLGDVLMERDLMEAERFLESVPANAAGGFGEFFLTTRGRLHARRGRLQEAEDDLRRAGELSRFQRSPAILPYRSELALVLATVGRRNEALDLAAEELELATAQGTQRASGVASRALAIVEGGEKGYQRLQATVERLSTSLAVLEFARASVDLGATIRRRGQRAESREPLKAGLDQAERCGANELASRARDELLAAGARPRRSAVRGIAALTPSELRVARLAAEGRSNREIAQALFVSSWTVATHLTHTYQKLGIGGRADLRRAVDEAQDH